MIHQNPAEEASVAALAAGTSVVGIAAGVGIAVEVETAADETAAALGNSVEERQQPAPPNTRAVVVDAGWLAKEAGKDRTEVVVTDAEHG